jgi:hypothetical protein
MRLFLVLDGRLIRRGGLPMQSRSRRCNDAVGSVLVVLILLLPVVNF